MRAAQLWKCITASVNSVSVRAFSVDRPRGRVTRFAMQRHLDTVTKQLKTVSQQHPYMSHEAFLELCRGICGDHKSERLAQMCYRGGYVLRLGRRVYTSQDCSAAILSKLPLNRSRLHSLVNRVQTELTQSQLRKRQLDRIAYVGTRRLFLVGLMAFVFQWLLFIRLTFVEFSWDIMEPIAYFTTMFLGLASYGYYLVTYRRPKYYQVNRKLLETRKAMLYQKAGFDVERYRLLKRRLAVYKRYLQDTERDSSDESSSSDEKT